MVLLAQILTTKTDGHNSNGIVDWENVENDKVEPDSHEKIINPQNNHQTNTSLQKKNDSVCKMFSFGRTSCVPNSDTESF